MKSLLGFLGILLISVGIIANPFPQDEADNKSSSSSSRVDNVLLDGKLMGEMGLRVVKSGKSATAYYAGRRKCQCGRPEGRGFRNENVTEAEAETDAPAPALPAPSASPAAPTPEPPPAPESIVTRRLNNYPWHVNLVRKQGGRVFCDGTLINSLYVLTASHCVDRLNTDRIEVWLHGEDVAETKVFQVESILIHHDYNVRTTNNDIALVKLTVPVLLGGGIVPVCVPADNENTWEGSLGTSARWVFGDPKKLETFTFPIISNIDCNTKTVYIGSITDNMLCAGDLENGSNTCQGDGGGPLFVPNDGRTTLVGIYSWTKGCGGPRTPGVYTRVGRYPSWIVRNSVGAEWCEI